MSSKLPKVPIDKMTLIEGHYEDEQGNVWNVLKLIDYSKKYPTFDFPLAAVDLSILPFSVSALDEFVFQVSRVKKTDLNYPIILSDRGVIADGWHRVAKAILEGHTSIKAIRLEKMPEVDRIKNNDE